MEIDSRLRDRLVGYLRAELPKVQMTEVGSLINYGDVFALDKGFSAILQKANKEVKEQVERYVGERPLVALMLGVFSRELESIPHEERAGRSKLGDLPQYSDTEALANRIVGMLLALPRRYLVALELPASWTKVFVAQEMPAILGRQLAVVGSWHEDLKAFPVPDAAQQTRPSGSIFEPLISLPMLPRQEGSAVERNRSFLYVRLEGFVDTVFSPQPIHRFITLLKSFFGLAMGTDVLSPAIVSLGAGASRFSVYEERDESFAKVEDGSLDDGTRAMTSKLRVNRASSQKVGEALQKVIQILDMDSKLPQLALAGRWYFDSFANGDEVMGFMQLAISAETLLGTDEGDAITETLASRCGYLIATSAKERADLIAEFRSIYKVRSKIVHRGLGALKENERQQLRRLRVICRRILEKEIDLAIADLGGAAGAADLQDAIAKFSGMFKEVPLFASGSPTAG